MKKTLLSAALCISALNAAAGVYGNEFVSLRQVSFTAGSNIVVPDETIAESYCSNNISGALSSDEEIKMGAAMYLTATTLKSKGTSVVALRIGLGTTDLKDLEIFVTTELGQEPIYTKRIETAEEGWNYILFDSPVEITGDNLYFGYTCTGSDNAIGYDASTTKSNGNWIYFDDVWSHMRDYNIAGVVSVQAIITGGNYQNLTQYDASVEITSVGNSGYSIPGEEFSAKFTVTNNAVQTIKSFDLFVKMGEVKDTIHITDVAIANFQSYEVEWSGLMCDSEGEYPVSTRVFNLNEGKTDAVSSNNVATGQLTVFNKMFDRRILIEQFTGQACVNCPNGTKFLNAAIGGYADKVSVIAHHSYQNDSFKLPSASTVASRYGVYAAPMVMVGRKVVSGTSFSFHPGYLTSEMVAQEIAIPTPVSLDIVTGYNEQERYLDIKVSGYCPESLNSAYLSVWITQNGIVAAQQGATENYVHNNAPRLMVTPVWGDSLNRKGTEFENEYFVILPESVGPFDCISGNMKVVAFVYNNSGVAAGSHVYNVAEKRFSDYTAISGPDADEDIRYQIKDKKILFGNGVVRTELYALNGTLAGASNGEGIAVKTRGIYILKLFTKNGEVKTEKVVIK